MESKGNGRRGNVCKSLAPVNPDAAPAREQKLPHIKYIYVGQLHHTKPLWLRVWAANTNSIFPMSQLPSKTRNVPSSPRVLEACLAFYKQAAQGVQTTNLVHT